MKQRIRALGKKLELQTYANDKMVTFSIASAAAPDQSELGISIPLPIVFRLYHIGRAYDLHQIKNLHPTGSVAFDYISQQLLTQELEQIAELISDPVLHHFCDLLLPYLKAGRADTKSMLIVRVP